tara:strand:+ start:184 stop:378 length:195 start_codon:yes stop_codon:yes gene_type:complete
MVEKNAENIGITSEDINVAFAAYPEAAQAAQINLLQRVLTAREEEIASLYQKIEALESKGKSKT